MARRMKARSLLGVFLPKSAVMPVEMSAADMSVMLQAMASRERRITITKMAGARIPLHAKVTTGDGTTYKIVDVSDPDAIIAELVEN